MENRISLFNLFAAGVIAGVLYKVYRDVKANAGRSLSNKSVSFGVRG